MEKTTAVINAIFDQSIKEEKKLRHMTLHKYCYLSCGHWYAISNQWPLSENFEAWNYGPVLKTVYHKFKHFGDHYIDPLYEESRQSVPQSLLYVIKIVFAQYKHLPDMQLSDLTHAKGSPWRQTVEEKGLGKIIAREKILHYFRERTAHTPVKQHNRQDFEKIDYDYDALPIEHAGPVHSAAKKKSTTAYNAQNVTRGVQPAYSAKNR